MDLMELLKTRRTYRRFDQSKRIPAEVVEEIILSQQYASSAANRQPLAYVVVETPELVESVYNEVKWAGYLPAEQGFPKEGEHPTMFIAVLEDLSLKNNLTGCDAGLAISNMTLAAWSHGVGSCIMGAINRDNIMKILDIDPEKYDIHTVLAFGYPVHKSYIEEIGKDESIKYYLDENRDYVVPKKKIADIVVRK